MNKLNLNLSLIFLKSNKLKLIQTRKCLIEFGLICLRRKRKGTSKTQHINAYYIKLRVIFCGILGEKISPIEVDAVLLSHPDIAQAVAFGVPDDKYGEEVLAPIHCSFPLFNIAINSLST